MKARIRDDVRKLLLQTVSEKNHFELSVVPPEYSGNKRFEEEAYARILGLIGGAQSARVKPLGRKREFRLDEDFLDQNRAKEFILSDSSEPLRGPLTVIFKGFDPELESFVSECFNPTFVRNVGALIGEAVIRKIKAEIVSAPSQCFVIIDPSGIERVSIFAGDEQIKMLLNYCYRNSKLTDGFLSLYG